MKAPGSSSKDPRSTCGSVDHRLHRRQFLEGVVLGGAASVCSFSGLFSVPAFAEKVKKQQKRCILLWLCGAPSQFETWDPKPGKPSAGPFGSIKTKIPGIHFSELMPKCATINDKFSIIRSMKTSQSEHFQAIDLLNRGDEPRPPFVRPTLGSVIGEQLAEAESPIPNFVLLDPCPEGNEYKRFKAGNWGGWLGAGQNPVRVGGEYKIENVIRPEALSEVDHSEREALRKFLSRKFENERKSKAAGAHNAEFERVKGLMSCASLFDLARLPKKDRERYGLGTFAQHSLLARHLVENGAPFVMVSNGMPWDCHVFNHEIHQMLVPELDQVLYHLVNDLEERGMLDNTLVIAMGEFGRTPWLNAARGRDHYPTAWSMMMAGCGIKRGQVYGATDELGFHVSKDQVDQRRLFATIFTALGIDPHAEYDLGDLPTFHRVEKKAKPIKEILS